MWVEILKHSVYGVLNELVFVEAVHIKCIDGKFCNLKFAYRTLRPEVDFALCVRAYDA